MLNNSAINVGWNPNCKREIEEAKTVYIKARKGNRKIVDLNGETVTSFRPALCGMIIKEKMIGENQFAAHILDETGDRRLIWDMNSPKEVKEVFSVFEKHLKDGGRIYAIREDGSRGPRLNGFDASKEEVVLEDGAREKLKNFANSFREVKALPRTYPG